MPYRRKKVGERHDAVAEQCRKLARQTHSSSALTRGEAVTRLLAAHRQAQGGSHVEGSALSDEKAVVWHALLKHGSVAKVVELLDSPHARAPTAALLAGVLSLAVGAPPFDYREELVAAGAVGRLVGLLECEDMTIASDAAGVLAHLMIVAPWRRGRGAAEVAERTRGQERVRAVWLAGAVDPLIRRPHLILASPGPCPAPARVYTIP
jgi:hypothetical protein